MKWTLFSLFLITSIHATTIADFFAIDPELDGAIIGVYIEDAASGKEVLAHNSDLNLQLASLTKLATGYVAIEKLGGAFRYQTTLEYSGVIDKKGGLQGDLIIRGGGDPTLALDVIPEWGFAVKRKGIHAVSGRVIADASCFETLSTSPHWEYMDLGNYYAAGASGLSINQNSYRVTFAPGSQIGEKAEVIKVDPVIPTLTISNEMKTGPKGSGDHGYIYGSEYSPLQIYRGTIPSGVEEFSIRGAIPDPARFTAETFSRHLQLANPAKVVRKKGGVQGATEIISTKKSPPLKQIVREMLQSSNNLYAEHLLKTLGNGESKRGLSIVKKTLADLGVIVHLKDGCGAARTNIGSPKNMVGLIRAMRRAPELREAVDALPELGASGTLAVLDGINGARVFGKTGTMSGINNLAGYIVLQDGRSYNFCIMLNNFTCRPGTAKKEIRRFLQTFIEEVL